MFGYSLDIGLDAEESRTEVGSSIGRSYGKVGSYVRISIEHRGGNIVGFPLVDALGTGSRTEVGSSGGRSDVEVS